MGVGLGMGPAGLDGVSHDDMMAAIVNRQPLNEEFIPPQFGYRNWVKRWRPPPPPPPIPNVSRVVVRACGVGLGGAHCVLGCTWCVKAATRAPPPQPRLLCAIISQGNSFYERFKRRIEIMKQNNLYHVTLPPKLEFQMRRAGSTFESPILSRAALWQRGVRHGVCGHLRRRWHRSNNVTDLVVLILLLSFCACVSFQSLKAT